MKKKRITISEEVYNRLIRAAEDIAALSGSKKKNPTGEDAVLLLVEEFERMRTLEERIVILDDENYRRLSTLAALGALEGKKDKNAILSEVLRDYVTHNKDVLINMLNTLE